MDEIRVQSVARNQSWLTTEYRNQNDPSVFYSVSAESVYDPLPGLCADAAAFTLNQARPLGGTYSGTGVSGTTFTPSVAGAGNHNISYQYTNGNGCTATGIEVQEVYALPTAAITPDPANMCVGGTLNMNGNPSGGSGTFTNHLWTGNTGPLSATNIQNPTFTTSTAGSYNLTYRVTDTRGCVVTDIVTVNVQVDPSWNTITTPATNLCVGGSVTFAATLNNAGNGTVQWIRSATSMGAGTVVTSPNTPPGNRNVLLPSTVPPGLWWL